MWSCWDVAAQRISRAGLTGRAWLRVQRAQEFAPQVAQPWGAVLKVSREVPPDVRVALTGGPAEGQADVAQQVVRRAGPGRRERPGEPRGLAPVRRVAAAEPLAAD